MKSTKGWKSNLRKGIFVLILLLVFTIPTLYVSGPIGYIPVIFYILCIVFSFIYIQILKLGIIFDQAGSIKSCIRGDEEELSVTLTNKFFVVYPKVEISFFISDLFGGEGTYTNKTISLYPKETREFNFHIEMNHIGEFTAGIKSIKISDFFGLFQFTLKNTESFKVQVSPRIYQVDSLDILNENLMETHNFTLKTIAGGTEYSNVREYVPGDPIKTIHFKLSARGDTYLTKQFESSGIPRVCIITDYFSAKEDTETLMSLYDALVETTFSIAEYARSHSIEHKLICADDRHEIIENSLGDIDSAPDVAANLPAISCVSGKNDALEVLRSECESSAISNLIFITSNPTQVLLDELSDIAMLTGMGANQVALFTIVKEAILVNELSKLKKMLAGSVDEIYYRIIKNADELGVD